MIIEHQNRKRRKDAIWLQLTGEQADTVDEWLFDERLPYVEILKRAEAEFGLKSSMASLGRYYRHRAADRQAGEYLSAYGTARVLNGLPFDPNEFRQAAVKLMGKAALEAVIERPDQIGALVSLMDVLLKSERNDLRREHLKQADRQFNYEAALASVKDMPNFIAILGAIEDDDKLGPDEKILRLQEILFDWKHQAEKRQREKEAAREQARKEQQAQREREWEMQLQRQKDHEEMVRQNLKSYAEAEAATKRAQEAQATVK